VVVGDSDPSSGSSSFLWSTSPEYCGGRGRVQPAKLRPRKAAERMGRPSTSPPGGGGGGGGKLGKCK
jgi:hypothetical protein